jgi:hypothetical protein
VHVINVCTSCFSLREENHALLLGSGIQLSLKCGSLHFMTLQLNDMGIIDLSVGSSVCVRVLIVCLHDFGC